MSENLIVGNLPVSPLTVFRWIFLLFLLFALLPAGLTRDLPLHLVSVGLFGIAAIAPFFMDQGSRFPRIIVLALFYVVILAGWAVLQSLPLSGNPLIHSIWQSALAFQSQNLGTISIEPADSFTAIIPLTLPFAVFVAAYILFPDDASALFLLAAQIVIAVIGAIIAIGELQLAPKFLLFVEKRDYLDSLTAYFVNRNTSATYLAINLVVASGFAFNYWQALGAEGVREFLFGYGTVKQRKAGWKFLFSSAAVIILILALMLTKSRAGIASCALGATILWSILAFYGPIDLGRRIKIESRAKRRAQIIRLSVVFVTIAVTILLFGNQALLRVMEAGAEDARFCMYPGMIQLLKDNWLTGTGFATFEDAFPPYRPSLCEMKFVWEKAHSFYLEGWISAGVMFPLLLILAVVTILIMLIAGLRSRKRYRWVAAAGLGVLAIVLAHSTVDFSLQIPGFAISFAAMMAAILRMASLRPTTRRNA